MGDSLNIRGLQFEDEKITSYLFTMNNKKILFDYGTSELTDVEISQLDYIFISHYHYDHICGLLENLELVSDSCKIYMSRTTKEVFEYLIKRQNYTEYKTNKLLDALSSRFNAALFNKSYSEDGLEFKFYRSGHCFGGFMLYIKDQENSLFFSSDMDYVSSDMERQYVVDEYIDADYAILDGTIINDDDFKRSRVTSIKYNEKKEMRLFCKIEKAVVIAKFLSEKHKDTKIIYDADLEPLIAIFYKNGYDCFGANYNIITKSLEEYSDLGDNGKIIYLSSINKDNTKFLPDNLFSLHIGSYDRKEFIERTFINKPKILLGHYTQVDKLDEYCSLNDYDYIKKGSNDYEKK